MNNMRRLIKKILLYCVLGFYSLIVLYPLFLMCLTSLKKNKEIFSNPFGFPKSIAFENYLNIFRNFNYEIFLRNSVVVSVVSILLILFLSAPAAYILAKYKFKLNNLIFLFFLAGIMIPIKLGTINIVQLMNSIGLFDSIFSLVLVYTAMGIPLGILILTGFIREIPEELSNAARIDGMNDHGIFLRIIVPLLSPALASVAIINILPVWNEFWFSLVLIRTNANKTIPLATASLIGQFETQWGAVFAVLTLSALPLMLLYIILSKQFLKGLLEGSLKGG